MEKKLTNAVPNWKKIKELRFDELRVRSGQKLAALAERQGWSSLAKLPAEAELLAMLDHESTGREIQSAEDCFDHFRYRTAPKFFASFAKRNATVAHLGQMALSTRGTSERANRLWRGNLISSFCGLSFGSRRLNLEPIAGKLTSDHGAVSTISMQRFRDKKIVWESNSIIFARGAWYW